MPPSLLNNQTQQSSIRYGLDIILTMCAPIFWGTTYIVTTQFLPPNLPFYAAVIRVLPAGIFLLLMTQQLPAKGQWLKILALSFLNISCFQTLLFVAAYRLPGGIAAVLGAIQPLIIMLLIWKINHIPPKPITVFAVLTTIVGLAMLLITPKAPWDTVGLLAALLGAVSMGIGVYLTKLWKPDVSNLTFTGWQLMFGGMMLLPIAVSFENFPTHLTLTNILGYAYLAIFGSLIAYGLWFRGISNLPTVAVSILGSLSPITAIVIGWVYLHQQLSLLQTCGFIMVLISVFIVQQTSKGNKL